MCGRALSLWQLVLLMLLLLRVLLLWHIVLIRDVTAEHKSEQGRTEPNSAGCNSKQGLRTEPEQDLPPKQVPKTPDRIHNHHSLNLASGALLVAATVAAPGGSGPSGVSAALGAALDGPAPELVLPSPRRNETAGATPSKLDRQSSSLTLAHHTKIAGTARGDPRTWGQRGKLIAPPARTDRAADLQQRDNTLPCFR
jgi:hypothetical protein